MPLNIIILTRNVNYIFVRNFRRKISAQSCRTENLSENFFPAKADLHWMRPCCSRSVETFRIRSTIRSWRCPPGPRGPAGARTGGSCRCHPSQFRDNVNIGPHWRGETAWEQKKLFFFFFFGLPVVGLSPSVLIWERSYTSLKGSLFSGLFLSDRSLSCSVGISAEHNLVHIL
jgi:hypothetical protein